MSSRPACLIAPARRGVAALALLALLLLGCTPEDTVLPAAAPDVATAADTDDDTNTGNDTDTADDSGESGLATDALAASGDLGEDIRVRSYPVPPDGFGEVEVAVEPGDTSMLFIATGSGPTDQVYIDRVIGPSVDYEPDQPANAAENAVLVPARDDQPFEPGTWTFVVDAEQGLERITVVTKTSDPFSDQVVDVRFYVVTDGDRLADGEDTVALAAAYRERGEAILAPHGLGVGTLDFIDAAPEVVAEYAELDVAEDDAPALRGLCEALTAQEGPSRRLVFGIVQAYVGEDADGTEGIAAGTPGSAIEPGPTGCVTIAVDSGRDLIELATSVWHEAGHHLGLLHTTEEAGGVFDLLSDTPECDAAVFDVDDSGFIDAEECADADGANFMFYDSDGTSMTEGQAFVLRNNPLFRQR